MRPVPDLAPEDSLRRFLQELRHYPVTTLPIRKNGILCGMVSQEAILLTLSLDNPQAREQALRRPLADMMRAPVVVARPEMTPEEVSKLCVKHYLNLIPVVDTEGYCLGIVIASDLLQPDLPTPRPTRIGGMATPFGVYLSDGTRQAGAGNLALIASGAVLGLHLWISYAMVRGVLWVGETLAHLPHTSFSSIDTLSMPQSPGSAFTSIALSVLLIGIFLGLMRLSRLSGYHAAEHQTVHAIERQELLVSEIVCRMPRAHPRCGTNLMAASMIFFTLQTALGYIPLIGNDIGFLVAALTTLFAWRPVGTFLQERLTTKPATPHQLASGIEAGKSLLDQYLQSAPARTSVWRRIWCMGMVQTFIGTLSMLGIGLLITQGWNLWNR